MRNFEQLGCSALAVSIYGDRLEQDEDHEALQGDGERSALFQRSGSLQRFNSETLGRCENVDVVQGSERACCRNKHACPPKP